MVKYSKLKRWIPECFYLSFHEVTDILKSNSRKNSMSLRLHRVFLYLLCFRDVQQLMISFFNHFIFQSGLSLLPSYSESCPCDMASKGCPSKLFIGCKLLLLCLDEFYISYYLSYPGQETPGASLVRFLPVIPGWKLVGNTLISSHNFFFFFSSMQAKEGAGGRKGGLYIITVFNQQTTKPLYRYIKSAKKLYFCLLVEW